MTVGSAISFLRGTTFLANLHPMNQSEVRDLSGEDNLVQHFVIMFTCAGLSDFYLCRQLISCISCSRRGSQVNEHIHSFILLDRVRERKQEYSTPCIGLQTKEKTRKIWLPKEYKGCVNEHNI